MRFLKDIKDDFKAYVEDGELSSLCAGISASREILQDK